MSNHDLDCSSLILLDETLALYYQLRETSYHNADGIGIFWQFITDEQLEDDEIEKELGYGCIVKDCTYVWIWDNILFPIPDYVHINDGQRDTFIFYVLQHCYKHGAPPTDKQIQNIVTNKIGGSIRQITTKPSPRKSAEISTNNPNNPKQRCVRARFTVGGDGRAYTPKSKAQSNVRITRALTKTISSTITMTEVIQDLYQKKWEEDELEYIYKYMVTMLNILLLHPIKSNGIWILCFGFLDKKTGEPLYCIADRLIEDRQNYKWKIRDTLYTATKIGQLTQLPMDKLQSMSFMNTSKYKSQIKNIQFMNEILSDPNKLAKIFNSKEKYRFTDVPIFKNQAKINKVQLKLGMSTQDFLARCIEATNGVNCIKLIPFLFFNRKSKDGYSIDGLLVIRIHKNIDIGISFKYNKHKQIIMPSGIHLDIGYMERQCKLANPEKSTSIGQYFMNFTTSINDLSIRGNNYLQNKCKKLEQQNKMLTQKLLNIRYPSIYCVTKTSEICYCYYTDSSKEHESQTKSSSLDANAVEFVMPGNDRKTLHIMETINEQK